MKTLNKVCAFTGHRPNKLPWRYDETDSRCVALKAVLTEQIGLLAGTGYTQFLSGMAEATDTWSALSVLSLREKNPSMDRNIHLSVKIGHIHPHDLSVFHARVLRRRTSREENHQQTEGK